MKNYDENITVGHFHFTVGINIMFIHSYFYFYLLGTSGYKFANQIEVDIRYVVDSAHCTMSSNSQVQRQRRVVIKPCDQVKTIQVVIVDSLLRLRAL